MNLLEWLAGRTRCTRLRASCRIISITQLRIQRMPTAASGARHGKAGTRGVDVANTIQAMLLKRDYSFVGFALGPSFESKVVAALACRSREPHVLEFVGCLVAVIEHAQDRRPLLAGHQLASNHVLGFGQI